MRSGGLAALPLLAIGRCRTSHEEPSDACSLIILDPGENDEVLPSALFSSFMCRAREVDLSASTPVIMKQKVLQVSGDKLS